MDYVVFGIGFGATILVLGLLLRDFGPRVRFRRSRDGGDVLTAEELVGKVSWTRFCNALGSVLALAGAMFLLITLVAMILVVSDDTGLWIMSIAFGVLLVIMAYWTWAYFHRFGSYGILPERVEPEPAPVGAPRRPARQEAAGPPPPWDDDDADVDDQDAYEEGGYEDDGDELEGSVAAEAGREAEAGPVSDANEDPAPVEVAEPTPATGTPADTTGEEATAARLETPEERLAHADSPIDHGSAEGDLDLAATGPRRPGGLAPKPAEPTGPSTADAPDADEPGPEDDRDRA